MHQFFKSDFFNFEAIRILGTVRSGGAEVAECLEALGQIKNNDPDSWQEAWHYQAQKAEEVAEEAQRHDHRDAAKMALLRAANYHRASAYMMTGNRTGTSDPRVVPVLEKVVSLFHRAVRLMDGQVHTLDISYQDGISLPAYLFLPPAPRRVAGKIPILVNFVGADSMSEEIYHMFPAEGPGLGYALVTLEGPGQGLTLHRHNIPMRPDWEVVNGLVLDHLQKYATSHPEMELDLERIAVAGASLGGYFALRAAADPRVKACAAVDPIHDLYDFATKHVSPIFLGLWDSGWLTDRFVDNMIWLGTKTMFQMQWDIATSSRFLGASSPSEILRFMKRYTLKKRGEAYLDQVHCPVFVSGATNSMYALDAHATAIIKDLKTKEKETWLPMNPGGGSLQAKVGAMALCNQRVFQFLDKTFNIDRSAI